MTFMSMTGLGAPLVLEVLQVAASNPNCLPSYTVSWSPDQGETYQLERSINGGIWTPIYTGTDLSFAQSNLAEAVYSYRVKVASEAEYSNTVSITVMTQNLVTFQGCLNYGVAPYTYRVTTRTGCGTLTNVDTDNDTRCGYAAGSATFYADINYIASSGGGQGGQITINQGEDNADMPRWGNNALYASSVKLEGAVKVTAYAQINFTGLSVVITESVPNLGTIGWNDKIRSVKVEPL